VKTFANEILRRRAAVASSISQIDKIS